MMMTALAELFREIVIVVLVVGGWLLAAVLGYLIVLRGIREIRFQHRERVKNRYRPTAQILLNMNPPKDAYLSLIRAPRRYRPILAELLLAPLRVAEGAFVENVRTAAAALGLVDRWFDQLAHRKWWVRAEAARALGMIQQPDAVDMLIEALDDEHEEVRAAAVEALGRIGDRRGITPLLKGLDDPSRHQRTRVIASLRVFGEAVTPHVLAYARQTSADAVGVMHLFEMIGGPAATDDLLGWCQDSRPGVRAAALRALGTIGVDTRAFTRAVDALSDEDATVRAMAARALGRSRRQEAARVLADHLDDDWIVAAHCAMALRALGGAGATQLAGRVSDQNQGGDLARQMLWEKQWQDRPLVTGGAA